MGFYQQKTSKYKNVKVWASDGCPIHADPTRTADERMDSKAEWRRFQELQCLERAGQISNLQRQPEFQLVPAVTWRQKTLRALKYKADFQYDERGQRIVEDVKGKRTKEYVIKRHLFLLAHPEIEFREIGGDSKPRKTRTQRRPRACWTSQRRLL
jgi:hypothetical protein